MIKYELDKAIEAIDKGYVIDPISFTTRKGVMLKELGTIIFLKVSPIWKPLKNNPRYYELIKKLKLV